METLRGILSFLKKKKKVKEEEISESFVVNGGVLLEELIKTSNGRYRYPIRNFSVKDLLTATNNFDWNNVVRDDDWFSWYKGSLDGRLILVRQYKYVHIFLPARDIAFTAQMCIHKNVLKLVGCCLEDEAIAMVHEHIEGRFLDDCIKDGLGHDKRSSLSWKCRLRAANEIASVVAYLHTALDRPVVHRDIKPDKFMIDQHGVVKLFDFSFSQSIPLGESGVEGKFGFLSAYTAPEWLSSRFVTEKCDVYSFGVILLSLLSGRLLREYSSNGVVDAKRCVENDKLNELVDPKILGDDDGGGGTDHHEQKLQFHAFAVLALRCTQKHGDDRPDMIEVAKELRRIERSIPLQLPPP